MNISDKGTTILEQSARLPAAQVMGRLAVPVCIEVLLSEFGS